jgi:hypothetical protein
MLEFIYSLKYNKYSIVMEISMMHGDVQNIGKELNSAGDEVAANRVDGPIACKR